MHKEEINIKEIDVSKLQKEHLDDIKNFTSSVCKELEDFLKENAWDEQQLDFSKTYLFFHNNKIVGYITLLMDKQSLKMDYPNEKLGIFQNKTDEGYTSVPALKIGRMCVIDEYNSQLEESKYRGLGKIMLSAIIKKAEELSKEVGCRLLTTHAKKATNAHLWYKKVGFEYSHTEEKTKDLLAREDQDAIPMFYDIKRIIT